MSARAGEEAGEGASVVNGLYIFDIKMRDGKRGQARGVVVLCDGRIMGGDSYFYYTGSYTFRNGKWRGDMIVNQHTEAVGRTLAFGGREVTCGFSGDYFAGGADIEGMALVGKTSVTFTARLTLQDAM
ncbi:GrlR family regulatory protein [Bradyrhizobium stylosanthis]|uniref:Type III secretion system (T3SS) negative regulator GrlR n=1 Tax=Bradyrhizobium stylosanthis TaxID=1803665 RepID=A0A560E5R3_9BRAD|nr:GrlR family regulatory protein [Bradyrhizobium stylosanthis]TWB04715.1 type III secretion system (T3SS) negative regulator GrlR [Bradyrhizobium stylosanthis]